MAGEASAEPIDSGSALAAAQRRRSRLTALKQRNILVGGAIVLAIACIAILAPVIAPHGPQDTDYSARLKPPGRQHLLGTDNLGKDIFSRVVYGARID